MLEIRNIHKSFGSTPVLGGIDLDVKQGDVIAIIGPSGSGKTTLLRCLNYLEHADEGTMVFDQETFAMNKISKKDIARLRKKTAFVFQSYNLFANKTALKNVTEGLIVGRKMPKEQAREIAMKALEKVGLADRSDAYPAQLSGGQQQRIALARALVISPDVLLMDEPLSNLDAKLRVEMRSVIRHTQKSVGITTVYVTHDQEEAMAISDRIAVMKEGVIQHVGTPRDIYQRPKNVFVATFIGRTNIVNAHVKDGIITFADGYHEHIDALDKAAEQDVRCSIRPEEFIICKDGTDGIHGTVQECTYLGLNTHYTIDTDQGDSVEIVEESSIGEGLKKGEKVLLKVKKEKINVFTKDGGTNLIRSDAYEKQ